MTDAEMATYANHIAAQLRQALAQHKKNHVVIGSHVSFAFTQALCRIEEAMMWLDKTQWLAGYAFADEPSIETPTSAATEVGQTS